MRYRTVVFLISAFCLLLSALPLQAASYTTDFPQTENPISESGKWAGGQSAGGNLWGDVQTNGTMAYGVSEPTQFGDPTAILTGTWAAVQTATATLKVISTPTNSCCHEAEVRLRMTISPQSITGYEVYCSLMPGNPYCHVARWNGPNGGYCNLDQNPPSLFLANGDVLSGTVTGSNPVIITGYKNGVQILQVQDTGAGCGTGGPAGPWTSGNPGIGFYDSADNNWSNFGFTNFSASDGSTPCTANATTATFASIWSSAAGGSTICLAPGTYTFSAGSKSSMVTLMPDASAGGTQANVHFNALNVNASQNVTFQGMTLNGATVGVPGGSPGLHIHFVGNAFTDSLCIYTPTNVNQDTLVDSNTFINVGQSCTEGRVGVAGLNVTHTVVNGVVISNNLFSGPGPSDGVQINGSAYGTQIGPGNIFTGILESGCGSVHCDSIQFYGADHTTITGNFFYNDSDGIMDPDCNGSPMTVTNNVFYQDPTSATSEVLIGGGSGDVFTHNTFAGTHTSIRFGNPNSCGLSSNETLTNNIFTGGIDLTEGQSAGGLTADYSLIPGGGAGAHTINGSPTYTGGTTPSVWTGFALTNASLGHRAASDGLDIGATSFGSGTVSPPPPPPPANACDLNNDGSVNSADVQSSVNQTLGAAPCTTANLQQTNPATCTAIDVQRVVNAVLGGTCVTGP